MTKIISLHNGIGDIKFDMTIESIVALMGNADEVESIDNAADEQTTILHYNDSLNLFFEGENPALSCIDIVDEDVVLFDNHPFEMNEKEIVRLMVANGYYEQEVDNEVWGERRVTFNEGNIDFYFDNGELASITIGK